MPQYGYKYLRLMFFSRACINNRNRMPCIVDKQFFTGPMMLTHRQVALAQPSSILVTEPAVVVPFGVTITVLLPEQKFGDVFLAQLLIHR